MKRPSPALVISCVALFASLGGTGYAATHVVAGDAKAKSKSKAPKYVTSTEVNKLIASYAKTHKLVGPQGLAGLPGASGSPGAEGKVGPQGPGAHLVNVALLGSGSETVKFGAWELVVTCSSSGAKYEVKGTGTMAYTSSFGGNGSSSGTSVTNGHFTLGGEIWDVGVGSGAQSYLQAQLVSGSTADQLTLEASAESGLIEFCNVWGNTIPLS